MYRGACCFSASPSRPSPRTRRSPAAIAPSKDRDGDAAALFYEAALRQAEPASELRAYARYRLAWVRLARGAAAAARGLFDEAASEGEARPESPESVRLAAAARADRAVAAWIVDPNVATDAEALPAAAALVDATGDRRGSIALHRRLLAARSLDDRFCAWRAAAARALRCLDRPASAGPRGPLPPTPR